MVCRFRACALLLAGSALTASGGSPAVAQTMAPAGGSVQTDAAVSGDQATDIVVTGTSTAEGAAKIETGTGNRIRGDAYVSGPITDRLMATVSGFYRRDDGLRPTGYRNADIGGQIKLGAT